jgi:Na+-transporting methylmalonyl-CoA/oxaloacetate decarboxylase gamma subunit
MRSRTNKFYFAIVFLISLCALRVSAQGRSTVDDYANRLDRAERSVKEAIERDSKASELATRMNEVKRLLPMSEEVEFNGDTIRVDNAWLHEAVDGAVKTEGDAERRLQMLGEISARLARLRQSVKSAQTAEGQASQDQRARLDDILARPEYQPEEERESTIARWIRRIKEFIVQLLRQLFGRPSARAPQTGGAGLVMVLRALILLVVAAALIFGAAKLVRRFQARQKPAEKAETREALGEVIPEHATAADLFAMASDLARQGEYRKAIRRAYIALLCDLDQRGKLRLGRSKTNRDYLDAMRSEQRIYPTFSVMTLAFERAWYGQTRATEEEFHNFVSLYQEAIK